MMNAVDYYTLYPSQSRPGFGNKVYYPSGSNDSLSKPEAIRQLLDELQTIDPPVLRPCIDITNFWPPSLTENECRQLLLAYCPTDYVAILDRQLYQYWQLRPIELLEKHYQLVFTRVEVPKSAPIRIPKCSYHT